MVPPLAIIWRACSSWSSATAMAQQAAASGPTAACRDSCTARVSRLLARACREGGREVVGEGGLQTWVLLLVGAALGGCCLAGQTSEPGGCCT